MYEPGESVIRYADIFPATVTPWKAPLPVRQDGEAQSVMLRAIVTERLLTIGWQSGQNIYRVDLEMMPEQTAGTSLQGGQVGEWMVGRRGGCRCNARLLSGWDPFPGVIFTGPATLVVSQGDSTWGLIPPRYSRA